MTSFTQIELTHPLAVRLRKDKDAPPLAHEPVQPSDLHDVASEAWRDGCLRLGHPNLPLSDLPMRLVPVLFDGSHDSCAGFKLQLTLPNGQTTERPFTFYSLRHVVDRAMAPLLESGTLKTGETCSFEVIVQDHPTLPAAASPNDEAATLTVKSASLSYLQTPLRPLLEQAKPLQWLDDEAPPVFYTAEVLERTRACAQRGIQGGVETGGALLGSLAACPDSGEFFAIIHDMIELTAAEEKKFSITYSGRTWDHLQRILRARQETYPERAERLMGQTHVHPFLPNDGKVCAECAKRAECTLTSASFASPEDQSWHKAVFARQPWALCHIHGLSARGDAVDKLYGLKDGRLQQRGYYLLPEFRFD